MTVTDRKGSNTSTSNKANDTVKAREEMQASSSPENSPRPDSARSADTAKSSYKSQSPDTSRTPDKCRSPETVEDTEPQDLRRQYSTEELASIRRPSFERRDSRIAVHDGNATNFTATYSVPCSALPYNSSVTTTYNISNPTYTLTVFSCTHLNWFLFIHNYYLRLPSNQPTNQSKLQPSRP